MPTFLISQQQQTIEPRAEGWSATLPFQKFDPSLGTLTDVQVMVNGTLAGSFSLENLGSVASAVSLTLPGTLSLLADGTFLAGGDFGSRVTTVALGAFDGVKDFAGTSGTVLSGTFSLGNVLAETNSGPGLARFIGIGNVDLTLNSDGSSSEVGDADLRSLLHINTGGVVTLQYQFIPPVPPGSADGGFIAGVIDTFAPPVMGGNLLNEDVTAGVTSSAQIITIPDRIGGWSTSIAVNKFDPSLGFLKGVIVTIQNDLTGTASVENLDPRGWQIGFDQSAAVSLIAPGTGTTLSATAFDDSSSLLNLGAYDGKSDFAGHSGTVITFSTTDPFAKAPPGGGQLTDAADLAAFTGLGTIALAVSGAGQSDVAGPANVLDEIAQSIGATIAISYVYGPTPPVPADYGTSAALITPNGLPTPVAIVTGALVEFVACFAAGTRIGTPAGPVAVEQLREGGMVLTVSGEQRSISWIGHRHVDCRRHPAAERVWPVRISAHAFGQGRPDRPLLLSPDHAVFIEGVLIPIKFLINGHTISQIDVDSVTYYHVELSSHDVLIAEGLPAESYLETGGRDAFENSGGPIALHPDFAADEQRVAALWRQHGYAPLLGNEGQLLRARLKVLLQAQLLANITPVKAATRVSGG